MGGSPKQTPRGCLSVFLLFFVGIGLLGTFVAARSVWKNAETYRWTRTDAEIIASKMGNAPGTEVPSRLEVSYRYRFDGRDFTSNQYERGSTSASGSAEEIYRLASQLAVHARVPVYVNSKEPAEAVLRPASLRIAVTILFPLIFVLIGVVGLFFVWRRGPAGAISTGAKTRRQAQGMGRLALALFSLIFFGVGVGLSFPLLISPWREINAAKNWPAVPCEIVQSSVREHSGDKGSTYSVEIAYRYQFNGQTYTSDRYGVTHFSSSGRESKAEVVAHFPVGSTATCYVNPQEPSQAVIERDFTPSLLLGLIPLIFSVIGLFGFVGVIFGWFGKKKPLVNVGGKPVDWLTPPPENDRGELTLVSTRLKQFFGISAFALVWNGLTVLTGWRFVSDWSHGKHQWGLGLFLIPFVTVGVLMIGYAARIALVQLNPRVRLKSNRSSLPLGGSMPVAWSVEGRVEGLKNVSIALEGREEAVYRNGKNTRTARSTFHQVELIKTIEPLAMRAGSVLLKIPASTMHSFSSTNNRIVWVLRVRGEIPRWPDIDDEFSITVLPPEVTS